VQILVVLRKVLVLLMCAHMHFLYPCLLIR
jgi:hypothetical protein